MNLPSKHKDYNLADFFKVKLPQKVEQIQGKSPSYRSIVAVKGIDKAMSSLEVIVGSYLKHLSDVEIEMISEELVNSAYTILDVHMMLKMGLKGKLGKMYQTVLVHQVTGQDGWIDTYWHLMVNARKLIKQNKARLVYEEAKSRAVSPPKEFVEKTAKLLTKHKDNVYVPIDMAKANEEIEKYR